jgi:polysaccharide pyruvyl transferase WcaK-like protein
METMPGNVAILHHSNGSNLGDDASVLAIVRNVKQRWPDADVAAFTMNPDGTAKVYGVPCYPLKRYTWTMSQTSTDVEASGTTRYRFARWLNTARTPLLRMLRSALGELAFIAASRQILKRFQFLILSGGGQLTERSGPWGFPYTILKWFLMAKSARVKCLILNVGVGPIISRLGQDFTVRILRLADYVSFRDEESQTLARQIGFTGKATVNPDIVYSLSIRSSGARHLTTRSHPLIGIAPMNYPVDPPFDPKEKQGIYDSLIARLAKFTSIVTQRPFSLALFGTDIGCDPAAIEDLRNRLRSHHNIITSPYESIESVDDLLRRMSELDYVVTCRFHGVVFAHLLNKPVLAVSHHPKVTSLMTGLGLSQYCVEIRTFDPSRLAERFECLVKNRDEVKSRLAATARSYKVLLDAQFDGLWPVKCDIHRAYGVGQ